MHIKINTYFFGVEETPPVSGKLTLISALADDCEQIIWGS